MNIRYCKHCNLPITNSSHAQYHPECKEIEKKIRYSINKDKYNANRRKRYAEKRNVCQEKAKEEIAPKRKMSPASRRWEKMSLQERAIECTRHHISYGKAQVAATNNTLPWDWGLYR